jgi:predicted metal-dependent phosphoesterase TrpH
MMRAAVSRGLTHLAITDHDRIDVAVAARDRAPAGLTVIVGEEVRTLDGDLIGLFLEQPVAPGRSAEETIEAVRAQGGLVGIPHPFDRYRGSLLRDATMAGLATKVDWVETHNARLIGHGNEDAVAFARENGLPGIAVSDAHSILEIGVAYTALDGDPSTPAGLLAALPSAELVPGRATFTIRVWTPFAKLVNRARGNVRVRPSTEVGAVPGSDPGTGDGL